MIRGFNQKDERLLPEIRSYGCLFLCFAYVSPLVFEGSDGIMALNRMWKNAVQKGYITGDLNEDGDVDDAEESIIVNHEKLANDLFALNVKYDGKHRNPMADIPRKCAFVFGRFVYKYGHFVVLNDKKQVVFDSLGNSLSVEKGELESMRWYYNA